MVPTGTATAGVMDRLKAETAGQHAAAEARPIEQAMVRGEVTREQYSAYIAQRVMIHAALEPHMARLRLADARFGSFMDPSLFQEDRARADLKHLGATAGTACEATRQYLSDIERWAREAPVSLLGAYYVFEGSKNGARYIARALGRTLGLSAQAGMAYLDPHGDSQRELWMRFRAAVNACEWSTAEADLMVAAAQRTFDAVSAIDDELWAATTAAA